MSAHVYTGTFGPNGEAKFDVDGVEVASYEPPLPVPALCVIPLRNRELNAQTFANSKLKLARARQHLSELDDIVVKYFASGPFSSYESRDEHGNENIHAVVGIPFPTMASAIAGDAIQNLRSSLDLMVCDLIRMTGVSPGPNSGFPSAAEPGKIAPKIRGVSERVAKMILRLKSTARWNEPLWLLSGLDNLHKHNRLLVLGAASLQVLSRVHMPGISLTSDGRLQIGGRPERPLMGQPGVRTDSSAVYLHEGDNIIYRRVPHLDEEVMANVGVVFGPEEVGAGLGVRETIFQLASLVERILVAFERRLP